MIIGTVLLVGAKLATRTPADLGAVAGPPGVPTADTPAAPEDAPQPAKRPASTQTSAPTTPATTGGPPTSTAQPAPEEPGLRSGTFDGASVTHKYGTLQLSVTIADGQITDVRADYTTSSPVSTDINNDALPKLRQEALAAQSAEIDTVSGATYTSDAYRSSLQSALDEAEN
jgi:uncharacterized protein with FMN-binding domain